MKQKQRDKIAKEIVSGKKFGVNPFIAQRIKEEIWKAYCKGVLDGVDHMAELMKVNKERTKS